MLFSVYIIISETFLFLPDPYTYLILLAPIGLLYEQQPYIANPSALNKHK